MIQDNHQPLFRLGGFPGWFRAAILLLALLMTQAAGAQQAGDQQRWLNSLNSDSVVERRQALNWLTKNGDFSSVKTVVKSLKDEHQGVRQLAEAALWAIWSRSGSPHVDELLKTGGFLISQGQLFQAIQFFDEVISAKPNFAEGYNKRATAWYMMGSYKKSLADIALTLERNPFHFGALSGAGYCMIQLQRYGEAVIFLQQALEINPNLKGVRELTNELMRELKRQAI